MKNITRLLLAFFLCITIAEEAFSQGPPPWAPAHGYKAKTRYVYFPDHNMYYDLQARNYIYLNGRNWEIRAKIPTPFISINLGRSAQVELDFVGERPYRYNTTHIVKYKKPKKIKEKKVKVIEVFEDHSHGHSHGHGRGHGRGHGKGHGKH